MPAIVAAASLVVLVAAGAPALAGGTAGDPQPELAQFAISATQDGGGTGAVLPNGTTVLAWPSSSTSMRVCTLSPGSRKCVTQDTLADDGGSTLYGPPEVVATGGAGVSVILSDITDTISYNSTNGGRTFSVPNVVGSVDEPVVATIAGGVVVTAANDPSGLLIQTVVPTGAENSTFGEFDPGSGCDYDASISTYHGGVLAACDDLSNTYVYYAPSGSDFNEPADYSLVDTIHGEDVVDLSGNAILTSPANSLTTGGIISFFNGATFGADHRVPDSKEGDDGYWSMQEVGPTAHVFFESRSDGYDLFQESTTNGVRWSPQVVYGSAINSDDPTPVLGGTGAGLVFESDGSPLLCQPVLNAQSVHVAFAKARVKAGVHGLLKGEAAPHLANQVVTLERLKSGHWYPVSTTRESSSGSFRFSVPGVTDTYRAVVNYRPGYYEYGYSNAATLVATH